MNTTNRNTPNPSTPSGDDTPTTPDRDRPASVSGDQRTHTEEPAEGGLPDNAEVPRDHSEDPAEG